MSTTPTSWHSTVTGRLINRGANRPVTTDNVHSAEGRRYVLYPVIVRYNERNIMLFSGPMPPMQ